jgi:hypothetical protein
MNSLINKYFIGTAVYSYVRKVGQVWDAKTVDYNTRYNDPPKPMPLGDKIGVVALSVAYAPALSPFWLLHDINYIDIKLRGLNTEEYFHKNNMKFFDYVFM